jgi:hypothetical protein
MPNRGIRLNIVGEQRDAFLRPKIYDDYTGLAQPIDAAGKISGLPYDHRRNGKLADQATAIPAGRQRGDHDFVAVGALTACPPERVGFAVNRRVVLLNTAVMAASEQITLIIEKGGANGDAAFGEALPSFCNCDLQHLLVAHMLSSSMIGHVDRRVRVTAD